MSPTVSIVIRTLNEEKWLGKVLEKLMRQSFRNFEIIIVDSGSKDRTLEIVGKYPVKLLRIRPEEFTYPYALNLGVSQTEGEYIVILSGHSLPTTETWLADGLKNFNDKKVVGVTGHFNELNLVGYFSENLGRLFFVFVQNRREDFCKWMTNTNAIIRKDLWSEYPFDESLKEGCEDYDWACEMLARGFNIIKDPKFNVFHSHFLLDKPKWWVRSRRWKRVCVGIDKRKRPGGLNTRI